jgi:DNA-binding response OmpR family regulator
MYKRKWMGVSLMERKALLINDSKFESLILKDMLQKLNFDVEIADEYEALYAIERYEPGIVIVNYIMEQTRGDKLIQLIKAGMPHIKCVLSSSNPIHKSDFLGGHIDGVLQTPASMFLLESVIKNMSIEKESVNDSACPKCREDLAQFNHAITFCPFCGAAIK